MRSRSSRFTAKPSSNPNLPALNEQEGHMVSILDDLAEFEDFRKDLLPDLRKLIQSNASPEQIFTRARAIVAARMATIAASDPDSKVALVAGKELLEHTDLKKKEQGGGGKSQYDGLTDEEVRALVLSKINEQD